MYHLHLKIEKRLNNHLLVWAQAALAKPQVELPQPLCPSTVLCLSEREESPEHG